MGVRRPQVVVESRVAEARDALMAALDAYLEVVLEERREPALLTAVQAADLLGVHHSKVHELIRSGLLQRMPGFTEVRISREALAAYRMSGLVPVPGLRVVSE